MDDDGRRLPNGATGELVIRGSHVMRGYWEKPEETAARLKPGPIAGEMVLYSGDLFRTDEEGWLYFVARRDDIIKSRGEKVSPREVENAISSLDGVYEVAVVGVADEVLGQAIKAFVTLTPGATLTERDVIRHCLAHLESFMAPTSRGVRRVAPTDRDRQDQEDGTRLRGSPHPQAERGSNAGLQGTYPTFHRGHLHHRRPVGPQFGDADSFMEGHIVDSTGFLEVIMFLEETWGITVEDDEVVPENLDSLDGLQAYLTRKLHP